MIPRLGQIIGKGNSKICHLNPNNPLTCFKISKKEKCKEIKRDITFFTSINKKKILSKYLPKYYGSFEDSRFIGYEQELFWNKEGTAMTVLQFLTVASDQQIQDLENELEKLKNELFRLNIIVSDLAPSNIAIKLDQFGKITRMVIIDGIGSSELIPIAKLIPLFGKLKLNREWTKFLSRYKYFKNAFKATNPTNKK